MTATDVLVAGDERLRAAVARCAGCWAGPSWARWSAPSRSSCSSRFVADPFLRASSIGTVLYASSTIGIMAVPVALLMIGGEFDLSAGVAVTTSALVSSMFSYQLTANVWVGVVVSLMVSLAIGAFNGCC